MDTPRATIDITTGSSPYTCPTATADPIGTEISSDFIANDCRITKLKRQRGSMGNLRGTQAYSNNSNQQGGKLTTINVAEYSKRSSSATNNMINGNNISMILNNNSSATPLALSLVPGGNEQDTTDSGNGFGGQMNTNTTTTATATPSSIHPLLDMFYNRQPNLNLINYNCFNNGGSNGNNNLLSNDPALSTTPVTQQFVQTNDNSYNHNFQQQQFNNLSDQNQFLNMKLAAVAADAVAAATSTANGMGVTSTTAAQQQAITAAVAAAFLQQVAAAAGSQQQHENVITHHLHSMMNAAVNASLTQTTSVPTSSWQTTAHHPYNNSRVWSNNKRYISSKKLDELKNT